MTTPPAPHAASTAADAAALRAWLECFERVFVLTGAGCSTASGIPDYRDHHGAWKRPQPVTWQAFVGEAATYRRYWARSFTGWPRFSAAQPNACHRALVMFERTGRMGLLTTQNVDGLHQRAGNRRVVDLHGRLDRARCLHCGAEEPRDALQQRLTGLNPDWAAESTVAPDGDADIVDAAIARFRAPRCRHCDGPLKPDVVFFGENVPRERYVRTLEALDAADAVLVVGSSLMVYSGFRFVRMAHERGLPVAILNRGVTRADALATLRLDGDCGETLAATLPLG